MRQCACPCFAVLLVIALATGCFPRVPETPLTRERLQWVLRQNHAAAVVRIERVEVEGEPDDRFVTCHFKLLRVIQEGRFTGNRGFSDCTELVHLPDHWQSMVREIPARGRVYLVTSDFAKWPILDYCLELNGPNDPKLRKLLAPAKPGTRVTP